MPADINIDGNPQSDESIRDLDALAPVTINSPTTTPASYLWEFLDWPLDSTFDQAWLTGVWGAGLPAITFTPDREGTWVIQLTDTNDSTTDIKIMGVRNLRTNLRVPGAGETTETVDTQTPFSAPATANHRGWALRRNRDLDRLDDLCTSGGLQLCYLDDVPNIGVGTVDAGTLVTISRAAARQIHPVTGERVPVVTLADANSATGYPYAGAIKAGRVAQPANPGGDPYEYVATGILNQSYVWVSRSGIVEGGAAGTLNLVGYNVGEYVYVSNTAGDVYRDVDLFQDPLAPLNMIIAGVVTRATNPGSIFILPSMSMVGLSAGQSLMRFTGMGEYSGLRIGRPDNFSLANEDDGTIEAVAVNAEAGNIVQGTVVSLVANGVGFDAWIADSSLVSTNTDLKRYGVVGVAVETVAPGGLGHFTVYGSAPNAITLGPSAGIRVVGSSTSVSGDISGQAVSLGAVNITDVEYENNIITPVGTWDGVSLVVGGFPDSGNLGIVQSSYQGSLPVTNVDTLLPQRANVWQESGLGGRALVDLPNTLTDHDTYPISIYEATVEGQALWSDAHGDLAGEIKVPDNDFPGAELIDEVANNDGLYGSFVVDPRFIPFESPVVFNIYGYTDDADLGGGAADVRFWMRVNACGEETGSYTILSNGSFIFNGDGTRTSFLMNFRFRSSDDYYGFLDHASGEDPITIDFKIIRDDAVASTLIVTRTVFRVLAPNKGLGQPSGVPPLTLWENQIVGHSLMDALSGGTNHVDNTVTIGADQTTVGIDLLDINLSEPTGYVAVDSRLDPESDVLVRAIVKYHDTAVATALGLRLWANAETRDTVYNEDLTVAGTDYLVQTETPAGATTAAFYETLCFEWTIPAADVPTSTAGIRWKLIKTTTDSAGPATAVILQLTNLQFYQAAASSPEVEASELYENTILGTTPIDSAIVGSTWNINQQVDYLGFLFTGGGAEEFIFAVKFDPRYNLRTPLRVDVTGWVAATIAAPGVTLDLEILTAHSYESVGGPAAFQTVSSYSVTSAAVAANSARVTFHTFDIPAHLLWSSMGAPLLDGVEDSHIVTFIKLTRSDLDVADYNLTSASVHADPYSNLAGNEDRFFDINEDAPTESNKLMIPGSSRHDENRSLLLSQYRYIWEYGIETVGTAALATVQLNPAAINNTTFGGVQLSTFIPFNIAVVGVYGWCFDKLGVSILTGNTLVLHVVRTPEDGGLDADTDQGIISFPLEVTSQANGSFRWVGNGLNFGAGDATDIPMVMLPADYPTIGRGMLGLQLEFTNNDAGNTIDALVNVQVEIALIPCETVG